MKQTRNTVQRKLVRDTLCRLGSHPNADEIYAAVHEENPHVSRGTVYRNLNLLAEKGEILRLSMPVGPDHFDCRVDDHYHFCCRKCGRVLDASIPYMQELNNRTACEKGCRTEWHRLVLVGLCPECSRQEEEEKQ